MYRSASCLESSGRIDRSYSGPDYRKKIHRSAAMAENIAQMSAAKAEMDLGNVRFVSFLKCNEPPRNHSSRAIVSEKFRKHIPMSSMRSDSISSLERRRTSPLSVSLPLQAGSDVSQTSPIWKRSPTVSSLSSSREILPPASATGSGVAPSSDGTFSEYDDDLEVINDFFYELDQDKNGTISSKELLEAKNKYPKANQQLAEALSTLMKQVEATDREININEFVLVIEKLQRVRGHRFQWSRTLKLESVLASLLKKGTFFDGLACLRQMTHADVAEVSAEFFKVFPDLLASKLAELRKYEAHRSKVSKNSKFSLDVEENLKGKFATLEDYYAGPEQIVGTPSTNVSEGIYREHC